MQARARAGLHLNKIANHSGIKQTQTVNGLVRYSTNNVMSSNVTVCDKTYRAQVPVYNVSSCKFSTSTVNTDAKANEINWSSDIQRNATGLWIDHGLPKNFNKILIANRGEIACRVIRTCKDLGIKTVAVFSDPDANSQFVKMADEAYNIGPAASAESYLRGDYIIELAKKCGAEAIHPGYGFLSENADFAKACFDAGVEFIGPPVPAITAMGSKSASKNIMNAAGVKCVPGYHGEDQSNETLLKEAEKTGYPIMLKAVLGGGGKGMRIVRKPEEFLDALEGCRREALASFKDDRVLLERYIENPRHIEFQVFADKQGNAVHLYERDCSVQRRHQKVFEEAPAPGMSAELRAQMGKSATDAAKAVGYVGAGTVEFIVDADTNEYFFMEMNTRLQVEHCVSEMVVQRDLVQWQLHVAAGYPLPATQDEIRAVGHAIELRVYAEDPYNNFFPATGTLHHMVAPEITADVRVESGVVQGDEVSVHYDPMISKLVVWAPNRDACLDRMVEAIDAYHIVGPPTNLSFARRVLHNKEFRDGQVTTKFIATHLEELVPTVAIPNAAYTYLTVFEMLMKEQAQYTKTSLGLWNKPSSFRSNVTLAERKVTLELASQGTGDKKDSVTVYIRATNKPVKAGSVAYEMSLDGANYALVSGKLFDNGLVQALVDDVMVKANVAHVDKTKEVHVFATNGDHYTYRLPTKVYGSSLAAGSGAIAPMAGKIVKVNVKAGDRVVAGQPLVIMEAMKMEHILKAAEPGVIKSVLFSSGDFVEGGKPVVIMEEAE